MKEIFKLKEMLEKENIPFEFVENEEMEGYQIDNECVQWCKKLLQKEINMEQYIALVKQKSGVVAE